MTDTSQTRSHAARVRADRADARTDRARSARAPRPHPLRSLAVSAGVHAALAVLLTLLPAPHTRPLGAQSEATAWRRVSVSVAFAPEPLRWPEPDEPAREVELAELAPQEELLEQSEVRAPEWPERAWFDEDAPPPPARRAAESASVETLGAVPDDLFRAPKPPEPAEELPEQTPRDQAEEPEPAQEERAEERSPADEEPTEEDQPPDVADADAAPEREGEAEEAEQSGEGDVRSSLVSAPVPRYPQMSKARGDEGTVVLDIHVDAAGAVVAVRVLESSGHALLDESARKCVRERWRFRPAREDEPRLRHFREPITFRIVR